MNSDQDTLRSKLRWLLAAAAALVYWRISLNGFVNYDDGAFVFLNPHVYTGLTLANLKWAFTTLNGGVTSYQPLVWLSHQLDCQLFGLNAGAQHLTNLWFHALNTVLLFTLLDKLTEKPWRSAVVAALFALHPLHVGTVAWVAERKTLLCAFFWLLTTLAYLRYVRRGGARACALVIALYIAALLCKPIAVSLPLTLLLLDFWPLRRRGVWAQQVESGVGRAGLGEIGPSSEQSGLESKAPEDRRTPRPGGVTAIPAGALARLSQLEGSGRRKCLKIKPRPAKVCSHFPTLLSP